jgi:hypothetical protein
MKLLAEQMRVFELCEHDLCPVRMKLPQQFKNSRDAVSRYPQQPTLRPKMVLSAIKNRDGLKDDGMWAV